MLERVGLAGRGGDSALTLSGGEARRAALARALVIEPDVLLLDEPLSSVDPVIKTALTDEFARILRAEGVTTLYVTHDQDEALVVSDRVGIMHDGRFVRAGDSEDVMSMPTDEWVAGFLGMEPPLRGRVGRQSNATRPRRVRKSAWSSRRSCHSASVDGCARWKLWASTSRDSTPAGRSR